MYIEIDFNSDEAIYSQLCDQIIMGIAAARLNDGDPLPSVRQLADDIGINMHTVNKAYTVLRQQGYVKVDRRRGAVISVEPDKANALAELKESLRVDIARASCRNISREHPPVRTALTGKPPRSSCAGQGSRCPPVQSP